MMMTMMMMIFCPQSAQQQTRRKPLLLSIDRTRTDGRTLDRYIDPAPHTIRAVSVSNSTTRLD